MFLVLNYVAEPFYVGNPVRPHSPDISAPKRQPSPGMVSGISESCCHSLFNEVMKMPFCSSNMITCNPSCYGI